MQDVFSFINVVINYLLYVYKKNDLYKLMVSRGLQSGIIIIIIRNLRSHAPEVISDHSEIFNSFFS